MWKWIIPEKADIHKLQSNKKSWTLVYNNKGGEKSSKPAFLK